MTKKPNIIFVFGDQHRFCDVGYNGNMQVKTPFLDKMQKESLQLTHAISGMPVCCPYRASLLTGQYPHTHGVFMNDASIINDLNPNPAFLADAYKNAGYETAYIGKLHVDGHGRESYIPRDRRLGFDYWQVLECTHNYNNSPYFGDENIKKHWDGYDAFAQTDCAMDYIDSYSSENPFLMVLSWGPPHNPYDTAPQEFKDMYNPDDIILRENVPECEAENAKRDIAGYYAHISALDCALEKLNNKLIQKGIEENTIFIYTSDHGDMLYSHGNVRKQRPWDESIRVPFLMKCPVLFGRNNKKIDTLFNSPDIMPTLLGLCEIDIPKTVEGIDYSEVFTSKNEEPSPEATIIECIQPFGEFARPDAGVEYPEKLVGGREFRGIRTHQYTYVIDLDGAWLFYDNNADPFQKSNLCNDSNYTDVQNHLDNLLRNMLKERGDEFLHGSQYVKKWGYEVDGSGTIAIYR